jgi:hypothetical protein
MDPKRLGAGRRTCRRDGSEEWAHTDALRQGNDLVRRRNGSERCRRAVVLHLLCAGAASGPVASPCVEAAGAESGWSVLRGVDVGRRRRSPLVYGCGQPSGPSRSPLFPAVPRFGRVIGSRRRHRSWAISTSAFTRPESCVETLSRPVVEDLGTTRPAHRTLWTTLLVVRRSVPSPWWIESFPQPCGERPARVGFPAQVSCALLCPRRSKICEK